MASAGLNAARALSQKVTQVVLSSRILTGNLDGPERVFSESTTEASSTSCTHPPGNGAGSSPRPIPREVRQSAAWEVASSPEKATSPLRRKLAWCLKHHQQRVGPAASAPSPASFSPTSRLVRSRAHSASTPVRQHTAPASDSNIPSTPEASSARPPATGTPAKQGHDDVSTKAVSAPSPRTTAGAPSRESQSRKPAEESVVPRVPALNYVPRSGFVGSYGGGDGMMTARQLLIVERNSSMLPTDIKKSVEDATHAKLCTDSLQFDWTFHVQVSSQVYGTPSTYNMMYQGWLFADQVEKRAAGMSSEPTQKWPLIGLFKPHGIEVVDSSEAAIGINELKPSDQHVHTVDIDLEDEWRFGSDMARFRLSGEGAEYAQAWAACVDVSTAAAGQARAHVSYLVIVPPAVEEEAERALSCADVPGFCGISSLSQDVNNDLRRLLVEC